jgi:hypothetical protein
MFVFRPSGLCLDDIAQRYDELYGQPSEEMKHDLQVAVKTIQKVSNWEYVFVVAVQFTKLRYSCSFCVSENFSSL